MGRRGGLRKRGSSVVLREAVQGQSASEIADLGPALDLLGLQLPPRVLGCGTKKRCSPAWSQRSERNLLLPLQKLGTAASVLSPRVRVTEGSALGGLW